MERLLLDVAAHQAATGLQQAGFVAVPVTSVDRQISVWTTFGID
jgi:hypothetical protein